MLTNRKIVSIFVSAITVASMLLMVLLVTPASRASAASSLLSLGKPAVASSLQQGSSYYTALKVTDGDLTTRWSSEKIDPSWVYVDLGASSTIDRVVINWWGEYATAYQIQVSDDATNWSSIYSTSTGDGAIDDVAVSGSGRYVRMYGTVRSYSNGHYSINEMEIYGSNGGATAVPTNTVVGPTATRTNTPIGPTATRTNTPIGPTATRTNTPVGPTATPGSNTLNWMGHTWNITNDPNGIVGAGVAPGSASNVFLDANGYLHVKITKNGTTSTAAEVFTTDLIGFGTYQWQIEGNVDNMDKAAVLGLFTYGPIVGIGRDGENEIDIEFSKWNNSCACNADFTIYPPTGYGTRHYRSSFEDNFTYSQSGGTLVTARIVWSSTSVVETIMSGLQPIGTTANVLHSDTFTPTTPLTKIPQVPVPLGINFWPYGAQPGSTQEVIIRSFQYQAP